MVHRWRRYDIATDENIGSRRYGTEEAIEKFCGEVIPGTAIEVDENDLNPNFPGMTPRDFRQQRGSGFQTEVRS